MAVGLPPAALGFLLLIVAPLSVGAQQALDIDEARSLYHTGGYAPCARAAESAIERNQWNEAWRRLKIQAELATGDYAPARQTLEKALERYPSSIRLRLLGYQVYRHNDQAARADAMLGQSQALAEQSPWRYTDSANRVVLGRIFLLQGADAREVLEQFYDRARNLRADNAEPYLATGQLALAKNDHAMAAAAFRQAVKLDPDNPDAYAGLAKSLAASDAKAAGKALAGALMRNPRHVPSLLVQIDNLIDAENYLQAQRTLDRVMKINRWQPRAWAYRAVLAHLEGDTKAEALFRDAGLRSWPQNPEVDHLIGRKLSQKYRFAEGAARQRQALNLAGDYLPAKVQLCQDLLRLGEEAEGWRLADDVYQNDGYNVLAFNLVTLNENLSRFRTLEDDDFLIRMDAREADIYGHRVVELLHRAKKTLCEKYDVKLDGRVTVEIFPEQKDFAVRTFGMPGGAGFLGVCFGRVITANSPASQGENPSNWEAVLWHEFCHVATLQKTRNKMPRWLSEGISVYEEKQENSAWGQTMNPRYRQMVLGGELTPVSELSAAFLNPKSPLHLQFAYYESSLVVEYLIGRHGLRTLQRILTDLANDVPINQTLSWHTGSLAMFESEFERFARHRAEQLAPEIDWEPADIPPRADAAELAAWNGEHPNNFAGLRRHARRLLDQQEWAKAQAPLEQILKHYPGDIGEDGAYAMLALVHRNLKQLDRESAVLERWAARDADALTAYRRLVELAAGAEDWSAVAKNAQRILAVNPLTAFPHRHLAKAAEHLEQPRRAIDAYRAQIALEPPDPADVHFQLARLLHENGEAQSARRQVLMALEEAPRYRDAHRLLLAILRSSGETPPPGDTTQPPAPRTAAKTEKP